VSGSPTIGWLSGLLECVLPRDLGEIVAGDLNEEFALRANSTSRARATRWFALQVLSSVPRLLLLSAKRLSWFVSLGVAIAAYMALGFVEPYMHRLVSLIAQPGFQAQLVLDLCIGFAACACGGFLSTWVRRGSAVLYSLIGTGYLASMMVTSGTNPALPIWFPMAFLVVALIAPIVGGLAFVALVGRRARRNRFEGGNQA
jgi:hypothetical protein